MLVAIAILVPSIPVALRPYTAQAMLTRGGVNDIVAGSLIKTVSPSAVTLLDGTIGAGHDSDLAPVSPQVVFSHFLAVLLVLSSHIYPPVAV